VPGAACGAAEDAIRRERARQTTQASAPAAGSVGVRPDRHAQPLRRVRPSAPYPDRRAHPRAIPRQGGARRLDAGRADWRLRRAPDGLRVGAEAGGAELLQARAAVERPQDAEMGGPDRQLRATIRPESGAVCRTIRLSIAWR